MRLLTTTLGLSRSHRPPRRKPRRRRRLRVRGVDEPAGAGRHADRHESGMDRRGNAGRARRPASKLPAYCRLDGTIDRRTGAAERPTGSDSPSRFRKAGTGGSCFREAAA